MLEKTRGIILHTIKYSENSLVLIVYTEEYGRQSYMLTGIHSKKTSRSKRMLQSLDLLSLEIYFKSSREMQKVKEYKSLNPLTGIHSNIAKTTIALFIAEILFRTIREEEKNPGLFSFLLNSIQYLDLAEKGVEDFHLLFLVRLSRFLGFFPEDNYDSYHSNFNLQTGSFSPDIEGDKHLLDKQLSFYLSKIIKTNYDTLGELEINGVLRSNLLDKLILYYQLHFDGLTQMKSHRILQEVFSGNQSSFEA